MTSTSHPYTTILNPIQLKQLAKSWLIEDLPSFDLQSLVCGEKRVEAVVKCKTNGSVLAGVPFVNAIANELSLGVTWFCEEGMVCPERVAIVRGRADDVLRMERVALNVLARSSGIATGTRRVKKILDEMQWAGILAATRKTTPGFRVVEKYSVLIGGGSGHRNDLSHMVMLKDNHILINGGNIADAIATVRKVQDFSSKIEVEVSTMKQVEEAIESVPDLIMLDNMSAQETEVAGAFIKSSGKDIKVEVSGGINEGNIHHFAKPSIDILSMSGLIQGQSCCDFSMKVIGLVNRE